MVGGGGDYEAIGRCFDALMLELETRMRRREQGFTAFRPLTVATDEMPSIIARCGRDVGDAWRRLVREGDKFRLWLIVGSQSTRVRSLGIEGEGDVLDNFHAVLYLGELARQEFGGLVGGMERPAVLHARNEPPRAVLVPYTPVRPMEQAAVTISPVRDTAVEYQAILTERDGLITPDEVAEIAAMLRQNFSQRRIESIVFGYCGGSSFRKVQSVKNHLEAAVVAR